jgi:hypothetical protein
LPPVLLALGVYAGEAVEHSLDWSDNRLQRCALTAVDSSEIATKWPGQETDGSYENGYLKPAIEGHDAPAKIGIANATANEDVPRTTRTRSNINSLSPRYALSLSKGRLILSLSKEKLSVSGI